MGRSLVSIDYAYRVADRDEPLIKTVLADYEVTREQAEAVANSLPLSPQWLEFARDIRDNLRPESLHDFRRKRLALCGLLSGGGILEEDDRELEPLRHTAEWMRTWHLCRSGWETLPARDFALRVALDFHRIGRFVDPGILSRLDEDRIGGPITPVHQRKHLTRNLLRFGYWASNILRHTDIRPTRPAIVCEIGGGYGGLARVLKQTLPKATVVIFDLSECLALTSFYLQANFPEARAATIRDVLPEDALTRERLSQYDFVLLPWWYAQRLTADSVDLFMNSASMQEMSMEFIRYYVRIIERTARGYFYWVNRWQAPVRYGGACFADYPLDERWRPVFVRGAQDSPLGLHEWLAVRGG